MSAVMLKAKLNGWWLVYTTKLLRYAIDSGLAPNRNF